MDAETTSDWREMSPEELEYHFNPRVAVPHSETYGERRAARNEAAMAWPGRVANLAYGDAPRMVLDLYPPRDATGPAPVHIFIHGGFWRSRSKDEFAYVGEALAREGFLAVIISYPLCPADDLDGVVAGAREAFAWVVNNIAAYGGDPGRITLSGHSAGAHLGAAIIAGDWAARGLPGEPLAGAVLISGIFDPEPARQTSINGDLKLTDGQIGRHNLVAQPPRLDCPVVVLAGGGEPAGWIAQSQSYAAHLERAGRRVRYFTSREDNHFDLQDQFLDPSSDIMRAIVELR